MHLLEVLFKLKKSMQQFRHSWQCQFEMEFINLVYFHLLFYPHAGCKNRWKPQPTCAAVRSLYTWGFVGSPPTTRAVWILGRPKADINSNTERYTKPQISRNQRLSSYHGRKQNSNTHIVKFFIRCPLLRV